jgi:hypothetical protein
VPAGSEAGGPFGSVGGWGWTGGWADGPSLGGADGGADGGVGGGEGCWGEGGWGEGSAGGAPCAARIASSTTSVPAVAVASGNVAIITMSEAIEAVAFDAADRRMLDRGVSIRRWRDHERMGRASYGSARPSDALARKFPRETRAPAAIRW